MVQTRQGWATLCRLLSTGRQRATKGTCQLWLDDLIEFGADGLQLLLHPPPALAALGGAKRWLHAAQRLTRRFGTRMHLVMAPCYDGQDLHVLQRLTGWHTGWACQCWPVPRR